MKLIILLLLSTICLHEIICSEVDSVVKSEFGTKINSDVDSKADSELASVVGSNVTLSPLANSTNTDPEVESDSYEEYEYYDEDDSPTKTVFEPHFEASTRIPSHMKLPYDSLVVHLTHLTTKNDFGTTKDPREKDNLYQYKLRHPEVYNEQFQPLIHLLRQHS